MKESKQLTKDLELVKFYKLEPMQEYYKLASEYLNKKDLSEDELNDLEFDVNFIDYYQNNLVDTNDIAKDIFKETFDIVESRETEHSTDNSKEWHSRLKNLFDFDGEKSSVVYVLKNKNKPVAFALFSSRNEMSKSWNLELVYSHAEYSSFGFAKKLIDECFKTFNQSGEKEIVSIVERKNKSSIALHQKLLANYNCNTYIEEKTGNLVYDFDLCNLNKEDLTF